MRVRMPFCLVPISLCAACSALSHVASGQAVLPVSPQPDVVKAKGEAKMKTDLKNVQWGKTVDGLQAGIRLHGGKTRFQPGERVPVDCYLRNTTDHAIAFTYTARIFNDEAPEVQNAATPAVAQKVTGVFLTGLDAALVLLLKPGETVFFPHQGLGLGEKQAKTPEPNALIKGLEQFPYLQSPTPGIYTLRQKFLYRITTPEEVKRLAALSRQKDRVIIEPMKVTLIRQDGLEVPGEVTTIPFSAENAVLTTGEARFEITANAVR